MRASTDMILVIQRLNQMVTTLFRQTSFHTGSNLLETAMGPLPQANETAANARDLNAQSSDHINW
jgi:hypothetical protein